MRVVLDQNPKAVKDNYIQRSANILACYRKNCASPSSAGQLILPEGMKLLPLYTNCLIKCDALAGGKCSPGSETETLSVQEIYQ